MKDLGQGWTSLALVKCPLASEEGPATPDFKERVRLHPTEPLHLGAQVKERRAKA